MAKKTTTFCIVCGAPVGEGVRYCCRFCKVTAANDQALEERKAKAAKKKSKKKTTSKKSTEAN